MAKRKEAILAIQDQKGPPRKVLRLLALADGSFAISSPYHAAKKGALSKVQLPDYLDLPLGRAAVPMGRAIEEFKVEGSVKLMYHAGGFVQFSRGDKAKIRSGRLPPEHFLIPKGLGIETNPLTSPIDSGPSVGALFYGITTCAQLDPNEKTPVLLFSEGDILDREPHGGDAYHHFMVDIYVIDAGRRREAYLSGGRLLVDNPDPRPDRVPGPARVFDLPTPLASLAIRVVRFHPGPEETRPPHPTYLMSGPRSLIGGYMLAATYTTGHRDEDLEEPQS